MNKPLGYSRWSFKLALGAVLVAVMAVMGHRLNMVDFQPALLALLTSTLTGLLAIVMGLIGTLKAIKTKESKIATTLGGSALGLLVVMPVVITMLAGAGVPRIHDITTDLAQPPEFVAIKELRASLHNPLDRLEPENLVELQQTGYPDLAPVLIDRPFDQAFEQVVALVKERDWEVVAVSPQEGRIEATDTTLIMGFKDDIVIRVQGVGSRTRVDMRSVSRVGRSDLGVNAKRIRLFLAELKDSRE